MVRRIVLLTQIFFTALFLLKPYITNQFENVLGYSSARQEEVFQKMAHAYEIETVTAFSQKEIEEIVSIAYDTEYVDDKNLEYGKEEVTTQGVNGTKKMTFLVTHWLDEELDRVLINTEIENPTTEVISLGKKIVWKKTNTPDLGEIKYWAKLRVFATKYDSTCLGCNNTTALGAPVIEGVCAVDPKVISMYTHFYVPGYGKCQALDVGGLVKGNRIDLAFRDAHTAAWGAEYVDIYLMDNVPEDAEL